MLLGQPDYQQYYNLEQYLFDVVNERFRVEAQITAFDFFCIIIWKANRSKSRIAKLLRAKRHDSLDAAVAALCKEISGAKDPKDQMRVLIENWKFRLPIASAILTVLYQDRFTVYDFRVCNVLQERNASDNFTHIADNKQFSSLWESYKKYMRCVSEASPQHMSLRDKDRYLWGKSFASDLEKDIKNGFPKKRAGARKK